MAEDLFPLSLKFVLEMEGGYNKVKNDKGGATNYGISLRFLQGLPHLAGDITRDGHVTEEDIKALTYETAAEFYRTYFWNHYGLYNISSPEVAKRALSFFVNMRGKTAALILQRAVRATGDRVVEDGLLGAKSFAAINWRNPWNLVTAMKAEAAGVYRLIVAHDPTQAKFLEGWLNRAYK